MNAGLNALLARYASDRKARRELLHRRHTHAQPERLDVAQKLSDAGAHRAAALWFVTALRASPGDARIAYRLANALRVAGHPCVAELLLTGICRRYPAWAEPAWSLAWLYRRGGDGEAAATALEHWLNAVGTRAESVGSAAAFLDEMGMTARAERILATHSGNDPGLEAERGNLLLKLGHFDAAEAILRRTISDRPTQAGAWLRLAQVQRWQDAATSPRALMQEGLRRPELDDETRSAIGFALAKVEDDLGNYAAAWATLESANALRARGAHFDRGAWQAYEQAVYATFTPPFFARFSQVDRAAEAPIFIVGMLRSGTTLLERRLGRHSELTPAGELELIEALGIEASGRQGYPAGLGGLDPQACAGLATAWRARLPTALRASAMILDKNPLNFLHLGWIACLFPHSRIIHCRRDPLDTALSLWFQNFAHPKNDYAYRKEDIAWTFGLYRRLMAYWARVLPIPIRTVDYEHVVAQPEIQLRTLVEWLNLEWESAVLESSADDGGAIATASLWQARQPVYARSVGRARRYDPWIAPLRAALKAAGVSADQI